jgi:hypothetical protein
MWGFPVSDVGGLPRYFWRRFPKKLAARQIVWRMTSWRSIQGTRVRTMLPEQ